MKTGVALPWAERRIDELERDGFNLTWANLKVELKMAFGDTDRGVTARITLANIKQGSNTVDHYIVLFGEHQHYSQLNDVSLTDHFKRGLNPSIFYKVLQFEKVPTTLAG
jgi:hypothetical protein